MSAESILYALASPRKSFQIFVSDSVTDTTPASLADGTATGFVFHSPKSAAFFAAVRRAVQAWGRRELWARLQRNGMARDFSWTASAQRYLTLYRDVARAREPSRPG